jgi:arylsulfatase A
MFSNKIIKESIFIFKVFLLAAFPAASYATHNLSNRKPNVVLIIIDDMGWKQLGCYGSQYYESPNIDNLAGMGVRFTSAYASAPVCSPTRAAIMIGKSGPQTIPFNPDKQGFSESFLTFKPSPDLPLGSWQTPELDGHSTDTITKRTVEFIKKNKSNPFFVVAAYDAIHNPLMERTKAINKYQKKMGADLPQNNPVLAAMVERLDSGVGQIMECLNNNELICNTIIIVLSDNGGLESDASQIPLRNGKGWLYEGGIRIPLIISRQGKIREGVISNEPVISADIFPTLSDLCRINKKIQDLDGISLSGLLIKNKQPDRKALYWHYPHYHKGPPSLAIRKGNFKLIEFFEKSLTNQPNAFELYDLSKDIDENNNLANKYPRVVNQLKKDLSKWRLKACAQIPTINQKNYSTNSN